MEKQLEVEFLAGLSLRIVPYVSRTLIQSFLPLIIHSCEQLILPILGPGRRTGLPLRRLSHLSKSRKEGPSFSFRSRTSSQTEALKPSTCHCLKHRSDRTESSYPQLTTTRESVATHTRLVLVRSMCGVSRYLCVNKI
jgi:hypothetical protein